MSSELVTVARLFYHGGLTKQEIGHRLGISRFRVARMLDQARNEGVVRIEIVEPSALDGALGGLLEGAFGVATCLVATDEEGALRTGAGWIADEVGVDDVVGIGWGTTLRRLVAEVELPLAAPVPIVQLCGAVSGAQVGEGPAELVLQLSERLGGHAHVLPAPALPRRSMTRRDLLDNDVVRPTIELFDRVTVALVGIGANGSGGGSSLPRLGFEPPAGAVGDLLVHVFDDAGVPVRSDFARHAIAMSPAQLERIPRVVAVAFGAAKDRAIAGALRTGIVDILVTDAATARAVLARA